mmetsp:Transcript_4867/g.7367  ORF Transcript_4867/g.7367 Transcript_4867/m.7367 type:complete len:468 (-) Transcript_4867:2278-3681(-)|eukprot:CAMPEP_0203747170 /NCGR_PEP_ID=MMETSP0098-20131031/2395_1 /ASSEMBLY_ACC=CAM_ASM_000208 /TAXON_ID=96639 /ORGANISM=" , Strain NY0313808BC1" /LENGTH=467 /DNA_ID=CAMNT_0050635523 /DNA_START=42 /DNA_END=1445 /DNA_ORIENTATION=-
MKFSVLFGAAIAGLVSVARGDEHVLALGDDDFDDHVAKTKFVLAEFYAPWCGHCKSLAPEYEKAAAHFKDNAEVSLVKIDATVHKKLAEKFGVQGFPTLKWIVEGKDMEYGGGRTESEIVSWVKKKTGPPAHEFETEADLAKLKKENEVLVVAYLPNTDGIHEDFLKQARSDDNAAYAHTSKAGVVAELSEEGIVMYRDFGEDSEDEPVVVMDKGADISSFVQKNLLPLVVAFSQETAPKIFGGDIKQHLLAFVDATAADYKDTVKSIRPTAKEFAGKYLFVTVDKAEGRILEFFGLTEADLPTARIVEMGEGAMKKFALKAKGLEADDVKAFVQSHANGELSPDLKSEEPIADADQGSVWVLAGKNHDEVVSKEGKHVLVEYYAPWCGHCKKLAPEYEKLGEHFKDDDRVIIAKMDATANEAESVNVQGFPTLKWFAAGSDHTQGEDFDGGRDFEGMKTFIEGKIA